MSGWWYFYLGIRYILPIIGLTVPISSIAILQHPVYKIVYKWILYFGIPRVSPRMIHEVPAQPGRATLRIYSCAFRDCRRAFSVDRPIDINAWSSSIFLYLAYINCLFFILLHSLCHIQFLSKSDILSILSFTYNSIFGSLTIEPQLPVFLLDVTKYIPIRASVRSQVKTINSVWPA